MLLINKYIALYRFLLLAKQTATTLFTFSRLQCGDLNSGHPEVQSTPLEYGVTNSGRLAVRFCSSYLCMSSANISSSTNLHFLLCFYNSSFIETLWVSACINFYFCVWLILVNIVSSRFTQATTNGRVSFFGWIVSHRRCIPCLLSSLFTDKHSSVLWLGHCECSSMGIPQPLGLLFSLP